MDELEDLQITTLPAPKKTEEEADMEIKKLPGPKETTGKKEAQAAEAKKEKPQ